MERIVVERTLDEPTTPETFVGISARAPWCLDLYRVRFLGGYLAPDGRRMICNYEAPDAEAVRAPSRQLNIPFDSIWSATVLRDGKPVHDSAPMVPTVAAAAPMELVIAEKRFDTPIELDEIVRMQETADSCLRLYRATGIESYLSNDRRRMICLLRAPDAEAVRAASRKTGAPAERVWTASFIGAGIKAVP